MIKIEKRVIYQFFSKGGASSIKVMPAEEILKLIIAEKPVLGRAIADAIDEPADSSAGGIIRKGDYVITWAYGHLLTLKEPQDYDSKYKKWSVEQLPIYFPDWEVKPSTSGDAEKRLNEIGELLSEADEVINAGDPDEEGQLLIDEIIRYFRYKGPVKRLWTGDTTKESLKKALSHLEDNKKYEPMGWSAYARSVADYTVGINMSRFFTMSNSDVLLSVGRVQTPTLGLVVTRDELIDKHVKQTYYEIEADVTVDGVKFTAKYEPFKDDLELEDGRIINKDYAEEKVAMLKDERLPDCKITSKET